MWSLNISVYTYEVWINFEQYWLLNLNSLINTIAYVKSKHSSFSEYFEQQGPHNTVQILGQPKKQSSFGLIKQQYTLTLMTMFRDQFWNVNCNGHVWMTLHEKNYFNWYGHEDMYTLKKKERWIETGNNVLTWPCWARRGNYNYGNKNIGSSWLSRRSGTLD